MLHYIIVLEQMENYPQILLEVAFQPGESVSGGNDGQRYFQEENQKCECIYMESDTKCYTKIK